MVIVKCMIYLAHDYIERYQYVLAYIIRNAIRTKYITPYIEKQIAYSDTFSEFENSDVTKIAFSSCDTIYSSLFDVNPSLSSNEYDIYDWVAHAYITLFLKERATFEALFRILSIEEMLEKYKLYHEMDIRQLEDIFIERTRHSLLDVIMKSKKLSTKELSEKTKIPFSTLSALRYGKRDINKVEFRTVIRIAKALNIKAESLSYLELETN